MPVRFPLLNASPSTETNRIPGIWIPYVLACLFILGGLYKAVDPDDAVTAVNRLGATSAASTAIVLGAAVTEIFFGINLLRRRGRVRFVKYSVVLLGIFTVFLVFLDADGGRSCGCTGIEPLLAPVVNPVTFGLIRNIALILAAEWYLWRAGGSEVRVSPNSSSE